MSTSATKNQQTKTIAIGKTKKRVGAINEHGVLHNMVMERLSKIADERVLVKEMLNDYVMDFIVYGPKVFPDWDIKARFGLTIYIKDVRRILAIIEKYDWEGPNYPAIKTVDAWDVFNTYFYHRGKDGDYKPFIDGFEALAEITGFHKVKDEEEYIGAKYIYDAYRVRELFTDLFFDILECEDSGEFVAPVKESTSISLTNQKAA